MLKLFTHSGSLAHVIGRRESLIEEPDLTAKSLTMFSILQFLIRGSLTRPSDLRDEEVESTLH
jgi:hypothetical protein